MARFCPKASVTGRCFHLARLAWHAMLERWYAIDGHTPLTYTIEMELIETSVFARQVEATLPPDAYRAIQPEFIVRPDAGPVMLRLVWLPENALGSVGS